MAVLSGGDPVVIQNAEGQRTTPSIVAFTGKGERLVGQVAKNQTITNPENTIRSIKRFMGRQYDAAQKEISSSPTRSRMAERRREDQDHGGAFSPEEISAQVLAKMKPMPRTISGRR